jgi:hypothetical protein
MTATHSACKDSKSPLWSSAQPQMQMLTHSANRFQAGDIHFRVTSVTNESREFIVKKSNRAPFLDASGTYHYKSLDL